MIAYYLKVTGKLADYVADGKVMIEHTGDVREDDPSIRIVEG